MLFNLSESHLLPSRYTTTLPIQYPINAKNEYFLFESKHPTKYTKTYLNEDVIETFVDDN